jgi:hypothetical protein
MVRFSLFAILASSALYFVLSARERKFAVMLFVVLVASIGMGWVARSASAKLYAAYTLEELSGGSLSTELESWKGLKPSYEAERNPQANSLSCQSINTRNSVAIRKQLFSNALYLMPRVGLTGSGLMSFGQLACFKDLSPHNDLLQATVEFGWLAGAAFLAMITLTPILLFKPARSDRDMRFLFLLCAFMIMLGMIYGQISRDLSLFMALGLAVSALSEKRASINTHRALLQAAESA